MEGGEEKSNWNIRSSKEAFQQAKNTIAFIRTPHTDYYACILFPKISHRPVVLANGNHSLSAN